MTSSPAPSQSIAVIGAGIVGVSTALWLRRAGHSVTLIDRQPPGEGTSHGNAGILAACAMVPVTTPGLLRKTPAMLANPDSPLFLRWSYLPRLMPWLLRYLSHATLSETQRICEGISGVVCDSVDQHQALVRGTGLEHWVVESPYSFAYATKTEFDAEALVWAERAKYGFNPDQLDGAAAQAFEPNLSDTIGYVARLPRHGYIPDPGGYVKALAALAEAQGVRLRTASVQDFTLKDGRITQLETDAGPIPCDQAVLTTGVWSKPLMAKLGLKIPLESERGYHIVFENATGGPSHPMMIAQGKFVATPMAQGLRCAGLLEFGGLDPGPSQAPLALLRRQVKAAFPNLKYTGEVEWMGHRPAPSDSLPVIGEIRQTGIVAAFGHHHIGLTAGPKTGRLVADLISGRRPNIDMSCYLPQRFA